MSFRLRLLVVITGLVSTCTQVLAHPHIWVTMKSEIVYNASGAVTGIRHAWMFDDVYSVFATQGYQSKHKGVFTREELAPLAQINIESLKDNEYFTQGKTNGKKAAFGDPTDYWLEFRESILTLHFMLPLKPPAKAQALEFAVYDPLYYVDFTFAEKDAVTLSGAPASCKLSVATAEQMGTGPSQRIGEAFFNQLNSSGLGSQFANNIYVKCP